MSRGAAENVENGNGTALVIEYAALVIEYTALIIEYTALVILSAATDLLVLLLRRGADPSLRSG